MNDDMLVQQHQLLRQQLMAQRLVINQQLGVPSDSAPVVYPRSETMRLLNSRPELFLSQLTRIVRWLQDSRRSVGSRLLGIPLLLVLVVILCTGARSRDRGKILSACLPLPRSHSG
jgi:hypothetical protein